MIIELKITADDKALEFSRNLGGIANYFEEALMTNAMEEHGISAREIAEPENLKVEVPVPVHAEPIQPDPILLGDVKPASDPEPAQTEITLKQIKEAATEAKNFCGSREPVTQLMKSLGVLTLKNDESVPDEIRPQLLQGLKDLLHA